MRDIWNSIRVIICKPEEDSGTAVTLKTGRREVPGSNLGRACRPSCGKIQQKTFA